MAEQDAAKQAQMAAIKDISLIQDEPKKPASKKKKNFEAVIKENAKKKKKQQQIIGGSILLILLIAYALYNSARPAKADARYGICYTVLELNIPYPHTLHVSEIRQRLNGALTLWYSHNDAFGQYRMEEITCGIFTNPETNQMEIRDVIVHKVNLSDEKIASINQSLIYLHQNPRILDMPYDLTGSLRNLYFDPSAFWNVQLNIRQSY